MKKYLINRFLNKKKSSKRLHKINKLKYKEKTVYNKKTIFESNIDIS